MKAMRLPVAMVAVIVAMGGCVPGGPGPVPPSTNPSPSAVASPSPAPSSAVAASPSVSPGPSDQPASPSPSALVSPSAAPPLTPPLVFGGQVKLLAGNGTQGDFTRVGTPNLEQVPFDKSTFVITEKNDRMLFLEPTRSRIGQFSEPYSQGDGKTYRVVSSYVTLPYRRLQGLVRYGDGLLVSDGYTHRLYRIDAAQKVTPFAGTGEAGFSGDGGQAINAQFDNPMALAADTLGNVYVADSNNHVIRRIDTNGVITTFAGTPNQPLDFGSTGGGDGKAATSAKLLYPSVLALDGQNRLHVFDERYQVRRIETDGTINLVVGDGSQAYNGDNPALKAAIGRINSMVVGPDGLLYLSDSANNRIRRLNADGTLITLVGNGQVTGFPQYDDKPLTVFCGVPMAIGFTQRGSLVYYSHANFRWQEVLPQ
jgi:sugar lactone lactonase YvrE